MVWGVTEGKAGVTLVYIQNGSIKHVILIDSSLRVDKYGGLQVSKTHNYLDINIMSR